MGLIDHLPSFDLILFSLLFDHSFDVNFILN